MPSKRYLVKDFFTLHHADICCIQESKLNVVDNSIWRSIGRARLDQLAYTPALGSAGGLIMGWNGALFEDHIIHQGPFCLSIDLILKVVMPIGSAPLFMVLMSVI